MNNSQHSASPLIIGIDGGGTKTTAWVASLANAAPPNGYTVLGKATAGPANQRAVGPEIAKHNLDTAIEAAFIDAGLPRMTVAAACLGLAGADRESDRRVILDWAGDSRLAVSVEVVNDAILLLNYDQGNGVGVALIAGTGSLAWGRNETGQTARCGGWGYLFSDEGSAFSIGRAVLNAVSQAIDGRGAQTFLLDAVMERLMLSSPQEIVTAVYSHEVPRAVVANMACLAFTATCQGDKIAMQIRQQAATELAEMVVATTRRLTLQSALTLSMTGSVLLQNAEFRQKVFDEISDAGVKLERTIVVEDSVSGALNIAARLVNARNV